MPPRQVSGVRMRSLRVVVPRGQPSTSAVVLAVLYGLGGAGALAGAIYPISAQAPTELIAGVGLLELAACFVLATTRRRLGEATLRVAVLLRIGLASVLVASLATPTAVVLAGIGYVSAALFATYAFERAAARLCSLLAATGFVLAVVVSGTSGVVFASAVIVVAVGASSELLGFMISQLRRQAGTDALTGLANRVSFRLTAEREAAADARHDLPLTLVMIDLDDFKGVNDAGGHLAGDALLVQLATRWNRELRGSDLLARYGGDEFALLLPSTTYQGATTIVNRLRGSHPAHWSAGIATMVPGASLDQALEQADRELYRAKRQRVPTVL